MLTAKKMPLASQDALLDALARDYTALSGTEAGTRAGTGTELDARDRAILDYAVKLTRQPWDMERADVEKLREHGFTDRGVHDICSITSYFAFVNRIADGLGVELEERFET